ncbi:MAG: hypothetical protein R3E60_01000 [Alphaproteobacteria bacterium]
MNLPLMTPMKRLFRTEKIAEEDFLLDVSLFRIGAHGVDRGPSIQGGIMHKTGHRRSSMFIKRGDQVEYLRPGAKFLRRIDRRTEEATILGVTADGAGIPHVRFRIVIDRPFCAQVDAGERAVALTEFLTQFPERPAPSAREASPQGIGSI